MVFISTLSFKLSCSGNKFIQSCTLYSLFGVFHPAHFIPSCTLYYSLEFSILHTLFHPARLFDRLEYLPFVNLRKNLEKMKKAFCFDYFSMSRPESKFFHVWFEFFPSYLSRKKEISETFLGLGLRPRPQKCGLGFEKLFLGSLFSTSVTLEKLKSDVEKFYFRRDMEKNQNKIPLFFKLLFSEMLLSQKNIYFL